MEFMNFSKALISWYLQNQRDLPWRKTVNPYNIWLSEIMLQQTRVAQGLPYYLSFIEAFPTVHDLANAEEEKVLKLWQGLGYYSRARNLHATAKFVSKELKGNFPNSYKELLKLKGIGEYTAAAIASISFNENVAVVDGNVFRVLARYFGVEQDISDSKSKKTFQELANSLVPKNNAANFNQAIMEFGAIQCTPKSPDCNNCIFNKSCFALQNKKVDQLPIKTKKTKIKDRFLNYVIIKDSDAKFLIEKRTENGIWKNLFQFPLIETEKPLNEAKITTLIKKEFAVQNVLHFNTEPIIHKLSHQHLYIRFFEITQNTKNPKAISLEEMMKKPFPIVIHNFIESNYF